MTVSKRVKVLVADSDLTALSRIYLCFLHQDFKVEACNDALEIGQRVKRFKPGVVVVRSAMDGLEEGRGAGGLLSLRL